MNLILQIVLVLSVVVIAGALVFGVIEWRQIRIFLTTRRIKVETVRPLTTSSKTELLCSRAGYAIHVFRQGTWVLEADLSNPGYEAVSPSIAGTFEGQVVKKESGLKGSA